MKLKREMASIGVAAALLIASTPAAGAAGVRDITATVTGRDRVATTAASWAAQGVQVAPTDLVATQYTDGTILVARRGASIRDDRTSGGGLHASVAAEPGTPTTAEMAPASVASAPYWNPTAQDCFASLFRGVSHMDACYTTYKMLNETLAGTFWRLDWRATMFTASTNRNLDWGWIHADQDAGPAMSWVDWSPDVDYDQGCSTFGLSVSVAGVGGGFSSTFCESIDISKTSGTTLGWFKTAWNWGGRLPSRGVDRKVAMVLGTKTTLSGTPVWGLSWDFAASDWN